MADKAKLEKQRSSRKGWVTKCLGALEEELKKDPLDVDQVQFRLDRLTQKLSNFDECQELLEVAVDETDVESLVEDADALHEKSMKITLKAKKMLSSAEKKGKEEPVSATSVQLPKIQLPHFSGNYIEWTEFWDQFKALVVDVKNLPEVNKFTYLRSALKGEALQVIEGVPLSAANFKIACDLLEDRYDKKQRIIFAHIQALLEIQFKSLREALQVLMARIRCLETLGVVGDNSGVFLTPLLLSRLPEEFRLEWSRKSDGKESDLKFLLDFLKEEVERVERSDMYKPQPSSEKKSGQRTEDTKPKEKILTATALPSASNKPVCAICSKPHKTAKCFKLTRNDLEKRADVVKEAKLCFSCLQPDHVSKSCSSVCSQCGGKHHSLLCAPKKESVNVPTPSTSAPNLPTGVVNVCMKSQSAVIMQLAKVQVMGTSEVVNVLFDTGADRTYISSELVNRLNLPYVRSEPLRYAAFGQAASSECNLRNVYQLPLQGPHSVEIVEVMDIPVICAPLHKKTLPDGLMESFGMNRNAFCSASEEYARVDVLIGLDNYWRLMMAETKYLTENLVAQLTKFGWIVSGSFDGGSIATLSHTLFSLTDFGESELQSFWELEAVGVVPDPVVEKFESTVQYQSDKRYEVSLPWIDSQKPKLMNNEKLAQRRFAHLSNRLSNNPDLESKYYAVFQDYLNQEIIEEVVDDCPSDRPVFYLPHHPVVRESSSTTKVRPVFDASCKGYNKVSLNDCMEAGPNLLPNLVSVLLRFRRWKIVLTADITKAFLQIAVAEEDRDVHRFLMKVDGQTKKMRFVRLPFGNRASPFLLNITIKHHLAKYPKSKVIEELAENLYVDDFLTGCDDVSEACEMLKAANEVMSEAGMSFAKWSSNDESVAEVLLRDFQDRASHDSATKVLGLNWNSKEDAFGFSGVPVSASVVVTKRVMLSLLARMFDPIGFLSPYAMYAKILFQDVWRLSLDWDEEVPAEISGKFAKWIEGLEVIRQMKVGRSFLAGERWCSAEKMELHGFGDASMKAYGACVYLRALLTDGTWVSTLVYSKGKVAPLKSVHTLPRLELLAAVTCAQIVNFVKQSLKLDVPVFCWTDSTIVLHWIKSEAHQWQTFISNRVLMIQSLVPEENWYHCSSEQNSADLLSRGCLAEYLNSSWFSGSSLLQSEDSFDGFTQELPGMESVDIAALQVAMAAPSQVTDPMIEPVLPIERWSSLNKAIRIVAWMRRVASHQSGEISVEEMCKAKLVLIKCCQMQCYSSEIQSLSAGKEVSRKSSILRLQPVLDGKGVLRARSRLQCASVSQDVVEPVILPKGWLSLLIVRHVHCSHKHAGVDAMLVQLREEYWIVGARRLCKKVKKECFACQRIDARPQVSAVAPLPAFRVERRPVFSVTGLDHAGPLFCADQGSKKFYFLLFTCAVVRCVHIELVSALSAQETVNAIRRFASRRGMPSMIISDNARGFVLAKDLMVRYFGCEAPTWNFIVPRAPWWGGFWERMIKTVKSSLKKTIGKKALTLAELNTLLLEIEGAVNCRPLTFVGDEVDAASPLTPAHFLIGRSSFKKSEEEVKTTPASEAKVLRTRLDEVGRLTETFWTRWSKEYIRTLPHLGSSAGSSDVKAGDLVLVEEDNTRRLCWPLGVVSQTIPGRDGLIRSVEIQAGTRKFKRPVQRIHRLEVPCDRVNCDL